MQFQYNVVDMCDSVMVNYKVIGEQGEWHSDIILDLYDTLLSRNNDIFNQFVERSKDDWIGGLDITHDALINLVVKKYDTMVKQNRWKLTEPNDANFVGLTTQITNIEKKTSASASNSGKPSSYSNSSQHMFTLGAWHIKINGEEKVVDGEK